MSLVAALGLVVAGLLFRIAMKIAVRVAAGSWSIHPTHIGWTIRTSMSCAMRTYVEAVNQRQELMDDFIDRPSDMAGRSERARVAR